MANSYFSSSSSSTSSHSSSFFPFIPPFTLQRALDSSAKVGQMDFNSCINIHNHMCTMERYAYALTLCASDKLGDCNVCCFFAIFSFFFLFYRLILLTQFVRTVFFFANGWSNLKLASTARYLWNSFLSFDSRVKLFLFIQTYFIQHYGIIHTQKE